jgi:large subunit ribosomal protein L22
MTGLKTNERPGTRASHRHARLSAYKARAVLDLIRGKTIGEADEILAFCERDAADVIRKVLDSAVANAEHNDEIPGDELFVSACYADEGPTLKRWRPRARGRATRIRKRTCHITIIVSRLSADQIARLRAAADAARDARSGQGATARAATDAAAARRRRVAKSRDADDTTEDADELEPVSPEASEGIDDELEVEELAEDDVIEAEVEAEAALDEAAETDVDVEAEELVEDEAIEAEESAVEAAEATEAAADSPEASDSTDSPEASDSTETTTEDATDGDAPDGNSPEARDNADSPEASDDNPSKDQ